MFAGYRLRLACALTLISLCCNNGNAQQTVNLNHICALLPNNAMIADTTSCNNYYLCSAGTATSETCGPSYYFSKDKQQCLPPSQVDCGPQGPDTNPCNQLSIGTWASVPGSCRGYYYCGANGPERSNCPVGQNFDSSTQSCQYNTLYPCDDNQPGTNGGLPDSDSGGTVVSSSINLCTYIQNGVFFGSAGSCSSWNICHNNFMTSGNCAPNLDYNVVLAKCDYVVDVNCSQVTHDPLLVDSVPTYGGTCNQYGEIKPATSCNEYYICNGQSYQLQKCSGGLYFDTRTNTCLSRLNAFNNCDRCIGSRKSFVNMGSNTTCSGYLYCVNGIEQSRGKCAVNFYFNEVAGACVDGPEPLFGCCNPGYNGSSGSNDSPTSAPNPPTGPTTIASPAGSTTIHAPTTTGAPTTTLKPT